MSTSSSSISLSLFESCKTLLSQSLKTKFFFKPQQIEIIEKPKDFYDSLKQGISNAKERIFFASLYLGKNEQELIQCVSHALQKNKNLKVYFMVDGLRGTRETPLPCSASLLATLVRDHDDRVDIRCYKTPRIFGLKESLIPKRFNEGLGLQHMKIYGFDDQVILSGANLSTDYFTNRQDRYYCFRSKSFADYYFKLHQLISKLSFRALYSENNAKYQLVWPDDNLAVNPQRNRQRFLSQASTVLKTFLEKDHTKDSLDEDTSSYPTVVYPVSQFTPLFNTFETLPHRYQDSKHDYSTEKPTILRLLDHIGGLQKTCINWTFTAGYFNMLPEIKQRLLMNSVQGKHTCGKVITASAHANGFFESKGISKYLPEAYMHLAYKFLREVARNGSQIDLYEWKKGIVTRPDGWSYHAKGIWIGEGSNQPPTVTIVGSSNYTKRAYKLDLESNCIINTRDPLLQEKMQRELENIMANSEKLSLQTFKDDPSKQVSNGVKLATRLLGDKL